MMKKIVLFITLVFMSVSLLSVNVYANKYDEGKVFISDKKEYLSDDEFETAVNIAESFSKKSGYNVGIIITDDINGKKPVVFSDKAYADTFGKNTDGIMILINNDTFEDHISTSGSAILMYSDKRIDKVFDTASPYLKNEDFSGAVNIMLDTLDDFYDDGVPSENKGYTEEDIYKATATGLNILQRLLAMTVVFFVVSLITFLIIKSSYRFKKAESARTYVNQSNTFFREKSDTYIREYTTSHRISSGSSGGGGSSRGSGRVGGSSVHRSSGGGSFGGGSRKR